MATETQAVSRASAVLRGAGATVEEAVGLLKQLKVEKRFGIARRLVGWMRANPTVRADAKLRLFCAQQHALCTYKDQDSPAEQRYDRAVEILVEAAALDDTNDQETLGIAGAIYKNRWATFARKLDLERSLAYYLRGYGYGVAGDDGYTAINAAYVLDLLAEQEAVEARRAGSVLSTADARREQARHIRDEVIATLPPRTNEHSNWWVLVTIAEAYFGVGNYDQARDWLGRASALSVPEWEYETTARQLASLARIQARAAGAEGDFTGSAPWQALASFLGPHAAALPSLFRGKVGLALSGGGFRASLFHIGVLARLAEVDALRSVEYLSCVSGGSIIGAHYYLEVRQLLESKLDADITRDDYIAIVQRIERDFLKGVQRNIRTRMLANPLAALRMLLNKEYTRTITVGDLFESELYARVKDGGENRPRWLDELFVSPKGETSFRPKDHNWRRRAKVPILVLNATTLNTGHNWQFTASWMGEPPACIDAEIDANVRLRRLYYDEAPTAHRHVRLGHAVAASACVPGLFEPIAFQGLYPDYAVRLVDGGVQDNQGVASLLEQGVSVMLVSDASGQSESVKDPADDILGVPLRSNSILQARVRQAQYDDLDARRRAALLRGLMFVHLKKDLDVDPVDWVDCADPHDASDEARPAARRGVLTSYGIPKTMQRLLSAIRTDLDSFHDAEAYALMMSGYRMTEADLPHSIEGFGGTPPARIDWRFLEVEPRLAERSPDSWLARLLCVSKNRGFKVWKLSPALNALRWIVGGAALLALAVAVVMSWPLLGARALFVLGWSAAILLVLGVAAKLRGVPAERIAIGLAMGLAGWSLARLHLILFDPLYLRFGRIPTPTQRAGEAPAPAAA